MAVLDTLIPFAGMLTGIIIVTTVFRGLARMSRNEKLAKEKGRHVQELDDEVAELRDMVLSMGEELREAQERLDFTERLLAASPEQNRIAVPEVDTSTDGG